MADKCPKCGIEGVKVSDCPVFEVRPPKHRGSIPETVEIIYHIIDSPECLRRQVEQVKAKLKVLTDKLPCEERVALAIQRINESIASHVSWRNYRLRQGEDDPKCGDLQHHEECLKDYDEVLQVLLATREAAEAAKET